MRSDSERQHTQTLDDAHASALDAIYCHARAVDVCTSQDKAQSLVDMFGTHREPPAAESWTAWCTSSHTHAAVFERAFRGCQCVFAAHSRREGRQHDTALASCLLQSAAGEDDDGAHSAGVDAWCGALVTSPGETSAARAVSERLVPSIVFYDAFAECERKLEHAAFVRVALLVLLTGGIALVLWCALTRCASLSEQSDACEGSSDRDLKQRSASAPQDECNDLSAHDTRVLDDPIVALSARTFVRVSEDYEFHFVKCRAVDAELEVA